ncbi:MAG TPA: NAD-dependent deacetylase, partial [Acidimicrobiales bacterium]|nr:NAD-dependent deacetylase [Acidimicrobiales bacterium]
DVVERVRAGDPDPHCGRELGDRICGGVLSADIVRFGDPLDPLDRRRAAEFVDAADAMVVAGSTLTVYPAAGLVDGALARGVPLVIVNAQPTGYDALARAVVRADVQVALPAILPGAT